MRGPNDKCSYAPTPAGRTPRWQSPNWSVISLLPARPRVAETPSNFAKAALLNWVCELHNSYVQCAIVPRPGKGAPIVKYRYLAAGLAVGAVVGQTAIAQVSPTYTASQSAQGKTVYGIKCASCHGSTLDNGEFGPPLKGDEFLIRWGGKHLDELFNYVSDTMPTTQPGSLTAHQYLNIVAYVLSQNAVAPASQMLTADLQKNMTLPASASYTGVLATGVNLPPDPHPSPSPLDKIRPVTEEMLRSPPDGEWLSWSRTGDAQGFSPLKQINKRNARGLREVWAVALPPGPNEATPLMHDGVLFVHSFKDIVQALDATSGNLLWQYTYRLPKDVQPSVKKSLAILNNLLFVPTSDAHMVALNVKSGAVVWNTAVADNHYATLGRPSISTRHRLLGTRDPTP